MKRLLTILVLLALIWPVASRAAVPAIQVSPLQYNQTFVDDKPKLGFIDVSNPTDSTVTIASSVKAFRQINLDGDLEFYDDAAIASGIQVSLAHFDLGPREAIRVAFTIDPQKLPKGGDYMAVFFETVPEPSQASGTVIAESARVGTLLLIQNGQDGVRQGGISGWHIDFLQFGNGISGQLIYANTGSTGALAYNPSLGVKVGPWGAKQQINASLVMPGNKRLMAFSKPGSYIGLWPLIISEAGRPSRYAWVLVISGYWRFVVMGLGLLGALRLGLRLRRR